MLPVLQLENKNGRFGIFGTFQSFWQFFSKSFEGEKQKTALHSKNCVSFAVLIILIHHTQVWNQLELCLNKLWKLQELRYEDIHNYTKFL